MDEYRQLKGREANEKFTQAKSAGIKARRDGKGAHENPYDLIQEEMLNNAWAEGWGQEDFLLNEKAD